MSRRPKRDPEPPLGSDRVGAAWHALALAVLLTPSLASAQPIASPRPIDGVVAIVGGHTPGPTTQVVLRSDVELRAHLAIATRTPDLQHVEPPPELLAATFQEILGELLIAREAERLHAAAPTAAQVARQRDELVRSMGGEERFARFLAEHDVDSNEIDAIAHRRAFVDDFLRANLEGSTLISNAQVEEVYAGGEHPFVDRPLEEVREPLRAWLGAATLQRDVRRWIEVLRDRTPVRIVVRFVPETEPDQDASATE